MDKVRVRYAPSPTGDPHVGNLRTALFNWLLARRHGGAFVLRVEDTDQDRKQEGSLEKILESLRWLGLDWDEGPEVGGPYGPYFQSQRLELYQAESERLLGNGSAYRCYCSVDELARRRKEQQQAGLRGGYNGFCRELTDSQRKSYEEEGIPSVVRFAMPLSGETQVDDLVRGRVSWSNDTQEDFVIIKSDGFPTYHLASVVDDHAMDITHVMRAEEWLPSVPRHVRLYESLGYEPPLFAHLPMIHGPDHSKLSKRHGAAALLEYRDMGYLPHAMINFMALLGWALDDKTDLMSMQTLTENFSIDRINKSAAIFDMERLQWMNGHYIREMDVSDLTDRMAPFVEKELGPVDMGLLSRVAPLVQERIKTLDEAPYRVAYFFRDVEFEEGEFERSLGFEGVEHALESASKLLDSTDSYTAAALETELRGLGEELGLSGRKFFGALRATLTGRKATPPLFDTMEVLGRDICVRRIDSALELLKETRTSASAGASSPTGE